MGARGIRGTFVDFVDDPWRHVGDEQAATRFVLDGLLVIEDGVIAAFGPYDEVVTAYPDVEVTHIAERLILPGFIDGHIHVIAGQREGAGDAGFGELGDIDQGEAFGACGDVGCELVGVGG